MRTLLLGIDSGTQSTKALAVDARDGQVLGAASQAYDKIPRLPRLAKAQHPCIWRDATAAAIRSALRSQPA
jgi:xylulokinase